MQINEPSVLVGLYVVLECESNEPLWIVAFRVLSHHSCFGVLLMYIRVVTISGKRTNYADTLT
jgi:hypothetical protein